MPVVSRGGQETALFLSRGERLAKLLALDKAFRLKVLPISLAIPWGLNVGDMLGHWPLPAKITQQVLEPIHLREQLRARARHRRGLRRRARPHAARPGRAAERAAPSRWSVEGREEDRGRGPARGRLGAGPRPVGLPAADGGHHPLRSRGRGGRRAGHGQPLLDAHARRLGRRGRAWWRSSSSTSPATWPGRASPASTSAAAGACGRTATGGTRVTLRLQYGAPGGLLAAVSDRLSAPMVSGHLRRSLENLKRELEGGGRRERRPEEGPAGRVTYNLGSLGVLIQSGIVKPIRPDRLFGVAMAARALGAQPRRGLPVGRGALPRPDRASSTSSAR